MLLMSTVGMMLNYSIVTSTVNSLSFSGIALSYLLWVFSSNFTIFVMARILGGISKGWLQAQHQIQIDFTRRECLLINCDSDGRLNALNKGQRHGNDRGGLLPGLSYRWFSLLMPNPCTHCHYLPHRTNDRGCLFALGERSWGRVVSSHYRLKNEVS